MSARKEDEQTMKKYYARMLKARCPVDETSMTSMVPVLQKEIIPPCVERSRGTPDPVLCRSLDALKYQAIDAKAFDVITGEIKENETFS